MNAQTATTETHTHTYAYTVDRGTETARRGTLYKSETRTHD